MYPQWPSVRQCSSTVLVRPISAKVENLLSNAAVLDWTVESATLLSAVPFGYGKWAHYSNRLPTAAPFVQSEYTEPDRGSTRSAQRNLGPRLVSRTHPPSFGAEPARAAYSVAPWPGSCSRAGGAGRAGYKQQCDMT